MPIERLDTKAEVLFGERTWILRTTFEALEQAGEAFKKKLWKNNWPPDEIDRLWLGFHEALINAIVHGNLGITKPDDNEKDLTQLVKEELKNYPEKKNKKVYVKIDVDDKKVYVKISDEGKGFKFKEVLDPTTSEGLKKTKGRGLFFMETYFDSVEYTGNGNEVILAKQREK